MRLGLVTFCLFALIGGEVHAQAYCALRDPDVRIYELYPDANRYRSVIRTVDNSARTRIQKHSKLDLHFSELGRHTLYVPMENNLPLGLVHVRPEQGSWGLVEIVWSLGLDLTVRDFQFQRCRESGVGAVASEDFKAQIRGQSVEALRRMLSPDGETVTAEVKIEEGARPLAALVIRCAIKTTLVTGTTYEQDIDLLRLFARGQGAFPSVSTFKTVHPVYTDALHGLLHERKLGPLPAGVSRREISLLRALNAERKTQGLVIGVPWGGKRNVVWLALGADHVLRGVRFEGQFPDEATQQEFLDMVGRSIQTDPGDKNQVQLLLAEVRLLAEHHLQ